MHNFCLYFVSFCLSETLIKKKNSGIYFAVWKEDLLQPVKLATIFANCTGIQINLSNWLRSRQWLTNRVLLCANPGKNYRKIVISDNASWAHAPTSFLIQTDKTSILIFKITFPFTVKYMTEYHRCFRLHWISNHL